jgi:hypothetical protein
MPDDSKPRLQVPSGSWESLKKIIRAYHAAEDHDNPTVDDVASLAGVQRPVVSANNNFLRSMGIVQEGQNKLTPLGTRLATGLSLNNDSLVTDALKELIKGHPSLSILLNMMKARGTMTLEAMRGEIILLAGLNQNSRNLPFIKAIIDMMEDSKLIEVTDDNVAFKGFFIGDLSGRVQSPPPSTQSDSSRRSEGRLEAGRTIPIPLGVGRLVRVELPEDWKGKSDLAKLLKMLELSLGEEDLQ